jgi:hypothetical protein
MVLGAKPRLTAKVMYSIIYFVAVGNKETWLCERRIKLYIAVMAAVYARLVFFDNAACMMSEDEYWPEAVLPEAWWDRLPSLDSTLWLSAPVNVIRNQLWYYHSLVYVQLET